MIVATTQDLSNRYGALGDVLNAAYGAKFIERYHEPDAGQFECLYNFLVSPAGESPFSVSIADDRKCLLLDGLPEQNGRAVMAIVKALPDVDPIMLADPDGGEFCIVTPDITADDVATQRDWRPISEIDLNVWG